jgi:hypothetical protein
MSTRATRASEPDKTASDAPTPADVTTQADAPDDSGQRGPDPVPSTTETAWFETGTGQWHVEVGSQVHENLVSQGVPEIPDPTAP